MNTLQSKAIDLTRPLDLPSPVTWRQVEDRYLCLAPEQPNWLSTDRLGAMLLMAMSWGETPRAALSFAAQTSGEPLETLMTALQALLMQIERQRFYRDAPITRIDPSTASRMLHLYLTNGCNLRCPQCYMNAGSRHTAELSTDQWLRVLDQFTEIGGKSVVSLSGGEPLLRPDLFEIAAHARAQGHQVSLLTNGTLIADRAMARRLASLFDWIQISLDGATSDVHDGVRGEGSFRRTVQAIRLLGEEQVRLRVGVTVMPQNASDLLNHLTDLLLSLGGTRLEVAVDSVVSEGRACDGQLCLEPSTGETMVKALLNRLQQHGWAGERPRRPRQPLHNCGYGGGVVVAATGDLHACPVLHEPLGNLGATPLAELMPQLEHAYRATDVDLIEGCAACDLRYICGGGCRVRNLRERGDLVRAVCNEETKEAFYRQLLAAN